MNKYKKTNGPVCLAPMTGEIKDPMQGWNVNSQNLENLSDNQDRQYSSNICGANVEWWVKYKKLTILQTITYLLELYLLQMVDSTTHSLGALLRAW